MRGVNKCILIGLLGKDPEVKYMPSGNAVASFSLATDESYTDKSTGQKIQKTEWHSIKMFGKLAEIAGQYIKKGSKVYIEGKLQTSKWQDKESGQDRYKTEIVADQMQMLDGKSESSPEQQYQQTGQMKGKQQPAPPIDDFSDDIPF